MITTSSDPTLIQKATQNITAQQWTQNYRFCFFILKKQQWCWIKAQKEDGLCSAALFFLPSDGFSLGPFRPCGHTSALRRPPVYQRWVCLSPSPLVHLDHTVDFIYKPEAGEEPDCAWKEERG